jgi:heme/copper-type cytochrome/quinol oxidase subunit 2
MGCCIAAQLAITRAAARIPDDVPVANGVPRPSRAAEVVWTLVPAVALTLVFALTWRALPTAHPPRAEAESASHSP